MRGNVLVQDFLNQTRALFNNSSRLRASPHGFQVRGGTCSSELESMCLCFINSWSQRLRLGKEVALALAACHASGVLHRDVTSFNVMLSDMHEGTEAAAEHALRWHEAVRAGHDCACMRTQRRVLVCECESECW